MTNQITKESSTKKSAVVNILFECWRNKWNIRILFSRTIFKHSILTKYFTFFVVVPASLLNDIENGEAYEVFDSCTWFSLLWNLLGSSWKLIGIVHMGRKIPTINSQLRRAKKMERLMVIFQWISLDQANIYLPEERESLRRWHQRRITHPRLFKEAWRFLV